MKKLLIAVLLMLPCFANAQVSEHNTYHKALEAQINQSLEQFGISCEIVQHGRYATWQDGGMTFPLGISSECTRPIEDPHPEPEPDPHPEPPEPDPDPGEDPPPPPPPSGEPSAYRGIPDPSSILGFDVYADYLASQTITGSRTSRFVLSCNGSASAPCLIDASQATFTHLIVSGSFLILEGGQINAPADRGPWLDAKNCDRCVIRDVSVSGPGVDASHSSAVGLNDYVVWLRGKIHGFGDNRPEAREQDFHGIKTGGNGPTWILDAEIFDNSGDSVQVGDASRGASNNVYIGGGFFHDNRENAVDIKDSDNVVVSGVRMSGFSPTQSDSGSAIVIHDDAFNAKIYDNVISDTNFGIVTSNISGHEITGNTITADSIGIQCRNTSNVTIQDNDITAPTRLHLQSNCSGDIQN